MFGRRRRDVTSLLLIGALLVLIVVTLSQIFVVHSSGSAGSDAAASRAWHAERKRSLELRELDVKLHSIMLQTVPSVELHRRLLHNQANTNRFLEILREASRTRVRANVTDARYDAAAAASGGGGGVSELTGFYQKSNLADNKAMTVSLSNSQSELGRISMASRRRHHQRGGSSRDIAAAAAVASANDDFTHASQAVKPTRPAGDHLSQQRHSDGLGGISAARERVTQVSSVAVDIKVPLATANSRALSVAFDVNKPERISPGDDTSQFYRAVSGGDRLTESSPLLTNFDDMFCPDIPPKLRKNIVCVSMMWQRCVLLQYGLNNKLLPWVPSYPVTSLFLHFCEFVYFCEKPIFAFCSGQVPN